MKYRNKGLTQEACAAKVGMSSRSGHTIEVGKHHTQQPKRPRDYKTRVSPIDAVWEDDLEPMLRNNPDLQPQTLFIYLQRQYQDSSGNPLYNESILRTLQRRVSLWKAQHGKSKEVKFPQVHEPGRQSLSDFTHMDRSEILIKGKPFKHMLYHFRLVYSKWSYIKVIQSGESFQALSEGLQEALLAIGGSTHEHRTDSLAAAFKNLSSDAIADLTQRYEDLCAHYNMTPTRNNKGRSHENGSVESAHGHFKNRVAQELILRGSNNFNSVAEYEEWLQGIMLNSNKRNSKNLQMEKDALQPLPENKAMDYDLASTKVSGLSIIIIKGITYSVPSQLVGHTITLHIYQHLIKGYLGSNLVLELERKYRNKVNTRYSINYRHIIHALIKKPNAFRFCQYRDEILPTETYQAIWEHLDATEDHKVSPKLMLRLLKLAADYHCEYQLGVYVSRLIELNMPFDINAIEKKFNSGHQKLPNIHCQQHLLTDYDECIPTNNNQLGEKTYGTV